MKKAGISDYELAPGKCWRRDEHADFVEVFADDFKEMRRRRAHRDGQPQCL